MSKRHLESRWHNALKKANHIQRLLDQGMIIRTGSGRRLNALKFMEGIIYQVINGEVTTFAWKDERSYDMELTIQQFNAQFQRWHYYDPAAVKPVFTSKELIA